MLMKISMKRAPLLMMKQAFTQAAENYDEERQMEILIQELAKIYLAV